MVKLGVSVFLLAFFFVSDWGRAQASWQEVYEKNVNAVVMVMSGGGVCTGTLVEPDLILTAAHCVDSLRPIFVSWRLGDDSFEPVVLADIDFELDLAWLKLSRPQTKVLPVGLRSSREPLLPGEEVATIGHPVLMRPFHRPPVDRDFSYLMSRGIVSKTTDRELITDFSVSPGNSGGPIFDQHGALIGVVSRKRIGPFIGQIGIGTSHRSIHQSRSEFSKDNVANPSFFSARTTFDLDFLFTQHSWYQKQEDKRGMWLAPDLMINLWDRVHLHWTANFSDGSFSYSMYGIGYQFQYLLENKNPLIFIPTIERIHYSLKRDDPSSFSQSGYGLGFTVKVSSFPIYFKINAFKLPDNDIERSFAIGFSLF